MLASTYSMKSLVRNTAVNAFGLFLLTGILPGVKILGGMATFIFGGFILSVMYFFLRPIFNLLALPLNLVTFGSFSFLINMAILYLLTVFIPQISISSFVFTGYSFAGFIIPKVSFNTFFAYLVSSLVLSITVSLVQWLIKK